MTGDCSVPIRAGIAIALLAAALALPAEAQTQQLLAMAAHLGDSFDHRKCSSGFRPAWL